MALTAADHTRVSDAITSAERSTAGEIFCVLARETDDYRAVPFAYAALAAIVLPPLVMLAGLLGPGLLTGGWQTGGIGAGDERMLVAVHAALSAALFVIVFVLTGIPAVKRRLTPVSLRRAATHRAAMESFLAHGIHVTRDRTGVLVFLSEGDRLAEIVADASIYEKVEPDVWGEAILALLDAARSGRIADGFVAAVSMCGEVLAAHFPPRPRDTNELPDKLIEI